MSQTNINNLSNYLNTDSGKNVKEVFQNDLVGVLQDHETNKLNKDGYTGTAQDLKDEIDAKIPIGTILYLTHDDLTGYGDYLLAQGQEVSRTTYVELFNKIGTKYGVGDGITTFNLPNITDYIILT